MPVKDFMTKKVVYVSPETTVAHAADLMREQGLRRLPVISDDHLVGLVTEGTMAEASPSKATSLSIYEMNYLLNKTKIGDIMIRDVITVSPYDHLEDAVYKMMRHHVSVLPVVENGQVFGIITDKDVFRAFLDVAGYGQEGVRLTWTTDDSVGALSKVVEVITSEHINISRTVVTNKGGKVVVEMQLDGKVDSQSLGQKLAANGVSVESIEPTVAKALD